MPFSPFSVLVYLGNRIFRDFNALLDIFNGILRIRFVLQRDRTICWELDLLQGFEDSNDIQMAFTDDGVMGNLFHFGFIFDV